MPLAPPVTTEASQLLASCFGHHAQPASDAGRQSGDALPDIGSEKPLFVLRTSDNESLGMPSDERPVTRPTDIGLLSDAAHELRSPLAYLHGYGDLIARGRITGDELRQIGERIRVQASRLSETVDEILALARIEAHRGANFKLRLHPIDQLIADALDMLGPERSERVEVHLHPGIVPSVRVDHAQICRALVNVFDNASKYSLSSTPITTRMVLHPGSDTSTPRVSLQIADRGIGIGPRDARRVFERFFRAEAVSTLPGTGLGLAITEQIIRFHGGRIRLRSRLGIGTVVSIVLPLER
jgi:signal transduction histidine kinase